MPSVRIAYLSDYPSLVPLVATWFEDQWPDHYGEGGADATADALSFATKHTLPIGVVAFADNEPSGFAVLKAASIDTHSHLTPWIAAGYVTPQLRRQGIGAKIIGALEAIATELGFARVYCGTATAQSLMSRLQWLPLETVDYHGAVLTIFSKLIA